MGPPAGGDGHHHHPDHCHARLPRCRGEGIGSGGIIMQLKEGLLQNTIVFGMLKVYLFLYLPIYIVDFNLFTYFHIYLFSNLFFYLHI